MLQRRRDYARLGSVWLFRLPWRHSDALKASKQPLSSPELATLKISARRECVVITIGVDVTDVAARCTMRDPSRSVEFRKLNRADEEICRTSPFALNPHQAIENSARPSTRRLPHLVLPENSGLHALSKTYTISANLPLNGTASKASLHLRPPWIRPDLKSPPIRRSTKAGNASAQVRTILKMPADCADRFFSPDP